MITGLKTKNYRNLDLSEGMTFGNLNIFIGPNGYGKTNLVRVLRFLQDILVGVPDERRGVNSFEEGIARFGYDRILNLDIERPAVVTLDYILGLVPSRRDKLQHEFHLELDVQDQLKVTIRREELKFVVDGHASIIYKAHGELPGKGRIQEIVNNDLISFEVSPLANDQLTFNQTTIIDKARSQQHNKQDGHEQNGSEKEAPDEHGSDDSDKYIAYSFGSMTAILWYKIRNWGFYESSAMNLAVIRKTIPELGPTDTTLTPSGENLVVVLQNLIREDIAFEEQITALMKRLFPQTNRLRVVPVGRNVLQLEWYWKNRKTPLYLDEMSDGTVRMLCWAVVLFSPKPPSLIVLDEPEAGVHPAWQKVLAGWIREASRRTQVIVSTHSSDLLDYFTDDLESVRVFEPAPDNPSMVQIRTLDPERLQGRLEEGWKLGDLYRVGDTNVGGWPW